MNEGAGRKPRKLSELSEVATEPKRPGANKRRRERVERSEKSKARDEGVREGGVQKKEAVKVSTYFSTLREFSKASRQDEKLTPAVQLVYRILMEEANRNYWQEGFKCLLDELEGVTHMSRPTIVNARMVLKTKGYIDFHGKPTKYTIYSLVNQGANQELN